MNKLKIIPIMIGIIGCVSMVPLTSCNKEQPQPKKEPIASLSFEKANIADEYESQYTPLTGSYSEKAMLKEYFTETKNDPKILADDLLYTIANSESQLILDYSQDIGEYKINIFEINEVEYRASYEISFPTFFDFADPKYVPTEMKVSVNDIMFEAIFDENFSLLPNREKLWKDDKWSIEVIKTNTYMNTHEKYDWNVDFRTHYDVYQKIKPFVCYVPHYLSGCELE